MPRSRVRTRRIVEHGAAQLNATLVGARPFRTEESVPTPLSAGLKPPISSQKAGELPEAVAISDKDERSHAVYGGKSISTAARRRGRQRIRPRPRRVGHASGSRSYRSNPGRGWAALDGAAVQGAP